MKKKPVAFLFLMFCSSLALPALTLVYQESTDSEPVEHTFRIEQTAGGYSIRLTSLSAISSPVVQMLETDDGFSVLSWRYRDLAAGTDIISVRDESRILLSGLYRGREVRRSFKVDSKPWYQLFPHGLEGLVMSAQTDLYFYAVGYEGIGAMRLATFHARRSGVETILWRGEPVAATRVVVTLRGLASVLWSGEYWYRNIDGRNLASRSDRGPGTGPVDIRLISER